MLARINPLIEDTRRNLFKGQGKPEPLRGNLSGWWSRRISGEHQPSLSHRRQGGHRSADRNCHVSPALRVMLSIASAI
ncbi:MAG: type II toxin-antitoxin system YoeB family toxin [Rhodopila sp.]